ncbi:hypothetical protein ACHAW5_010227 [Stephanodiscus triporus]|uniref:COMM domain-containing protein n=1 Tax=Stephanodiscus triporus TaxID=2934178 RepID=A0ABD3NN14_9STRA
MPYEDVLNLNWKLTSVGVSSMDHKHESCEEALPALLRTHTVELLRKALKKLTEFKCHSLDHANNKSVKI